MNSRRLMCRPKAKAYVIVEGLKAITAMHRQCPLWVISGHLQCTRRCPLCANSGHRALFDYLVGAGEQAWRDS